MIDRDWLHEFAIQVRHETLAGFDTTNTCILTTRLGLDVLAHYGLTARPQPVTVAAFNRKGWECASQNIPPALWPEDAWSVGVAGSDASSLTTRSWDGHLVILLRNPSRKRTLIDLTADQMDRPAKGLVIGGPLFMDLPSKNGQLTWSSLEAAYTMANSNRTVVAYRPMVGAIRWKQSPDWIAKKELHEQMVATVVKALGPAGPSTKEIGA